MEGRKNSAEDEDEDIWTKKRRRKMIHTEQNSGQTMKRTRLRGRRKNGNGEKMQQCKSDSGEEKGETEGDELRMTDGYR